MRLFEHADAGDELIYCRLLIGRHFGVIVADFRSVHAEYGSVYGLLIYLSAVKERLCGDAAAVEAGAAELAGLDQRHGLAELCGPDSRDVTAGASAENNYIVIILTHCEILLD